MIVNFDSKLLQKRGRRQTSGRPDVRLTLQKRDKPYNSEKKVIFDYLRSSDNQKFHFRMWLRFIFLTINIYLEKMQNRRTLTPCYRENLRNRADVRTSRRQTSGGKK